MSRQLQETLKAVRKLHKLKPIKGGHYIIDVELSRFERVMTTHEIPEERWMGHLDLLLAGDALMALHGDHGPARSCHPTSKPDTGPGVKGCTSASEAATVFSMERLLRLLPLRVSAWVQEQNPTSTREASNLADKFLRDNELDLTTLMPRLTKKPWERLVTRRTTRQLLGRATPTPHPLFKQLRMDKKSNISKYI